MRAPGETFLLPLAATGVAGVGALWAARVVPATIEIVDGASLAALEARLGRAVAPEGTGAMLIIDVDGVPAAVDEEARRVVESCRAAGATSVVRAETSGERARIWDDRRELSYALRAIAPRKINHDVAVPIGRIPRLFDLVDRLAREFRLPMPCFGHAGDGNIHVNILLDPADPDQAARAAAAERIDSLLDELEAGCEEAGLERV